MHLYIWMNTSVDGIPLTAVFYGFSDVFPGRSRTLPAYSSPRASRKNATGIIPNWMVALPMKSAATNVTGICSASPTGGKRCTPDAANARSSGSILCCSSGNCRYRFSSIQPLKAHNHRPQHHQHHTGCPVEGLGLGFVRKYSGNARP